jgi:hypothetical protein
MFNTAFFTPRNVAAIAFITAVSHFVARPIYNKIAKKG